MIIKYVEGEITVLEIEGDLFYFRDSPNLPELFDENLSKLIVPNFDSWVQAKTDQRYSLRGLRDMSAAFRAGLLCGISDEDARDLVIQIVQATKRAIFQTDLTNDYARAYFIELLDPAKVEVVHARSIAKNFNQLAQKSKKSFYNYLCRFWQSCNFNLPSAAAVFEGFIKRLGFQPNTPQYPTTTELDNEVVERVIQTVLKKLSLYHVSDEVVANVRRIQPRRVQRSH